MWPWGHLAVGYLAYALARDRRLRRPPGEAAVVVLVAATQLPDVVDKTLAWYLGVLPHGRSLGHSALVAALAIAVVGAYLRSRGRGDVAVAFGVGYASHLAADSYRSAVTGRWAELDFLGWPLFPSPESAGPDSVAGRFLTLATELAAGQVSPFLVAEHALVLLAATLWATHGFPGLGSLRRVSPSRHWSSE